MTYKRLDELRSRLMRMQWWDGDGQLVDHGIGKIRNDALARAYRYLRRNMGTLPDTTSVDDALSAVDALAGFSQ